MSPKIGMGLGACVIGGVSLVGSIVQGIAWFGFWRAFFIVLWMAASVGITIVGGTFLGEAAKQNKG